MSELQDALRINIQGQVDKLEAQRDALLNACKRALEYAPNEIEVNALRKAITQAEKEEA